MPRRKLYRVLYLPFLLALVFTAVIVAALMVAALRAPQHSHARERASLAAEFAAPSLIADGHEAPRGDLADFPEDMGLAFVQADGNPRWTHGRLGQDVVRAFTPRLTGHLQRSRSPSIVQHTVGDSLAIAFRPIYRSGQPVGAIVAAAPIAPFTSALRPLASTWVLLFAVTMLIALGASFLAARRIAAALSASRVSPDAPGGPESQRLPAPEIEEFLPIVETANRMTDYLRERLRNEVQQRNEVEVVLASMAEGVIVLDADQRLLRVNRAGERILGVKTDDVSGRNMLEVIRNADLQRFVTWAFSSGRPVETEVEIRREKDVVLQAHGTVLHDEAGHKIGGLIVLNDVTRLRQLENVRRDFVANVSHELRTPITSIKGFVETLQDGALDNREDAERFLDIVARQSDRLNAILEDLLSLSRIEQDADRSEIELARGDVRRVMRAAIQACQVKAQDKGVQVDLDCPAGVEAKINAPLLEQAVVNLIDNAIKYSEPGERVSVGLTHTDLDVVISVADHGPGIPREHLPRLFERFYRVDKARSRSLGGTGLGLAIVKHIAQVHGGAALVESRPGKGSTFSIRLPRGLA